MYFYVITYSLLLVVSLLFKKHKTKYLCTKFQNKTAETSYTSAQSPNKGLCINLITVIIEVLRSEIFIKRPQYF